MDGPWQMGHSSAEDYGKFALEAAKLMKWTDPNIKLIAAGSSNYSNGIDWIGWNRTVLDFLKTHADYLSLHMYVGNAANNFGDFLASLADAAGPHQDHRRRDQCGAVRPAAHAKIYIAWDEWNVWYRARGDSQRGRRILEERYNLEDALVVATFLNTFVNNAHIIKIANMAQLVNVIAPIFTDEKRLFLQTIYYPLALFANNTKGQAALELLVKCPTYSSRTAGDVPHLDASAAHRQRNAGDQRGQPPSRSAGRDRDRTGGQAICGRGGGVGGQRSRYQSRKQFRLHHCQDRAPQRQSREELCCNTASRAFLYDAESQARVNVLV